MFAQENLDETIRQLRFKLLKKRMEIIRENPRLWSLLQQIISLNKQISNSILKNPDFQKMKKELEQLEKINTHDKITK